MVSNEQICRARGTHGVIHTAKVDFHGMKAVCKQSLSMNGKALFAGEVADEVNLCRGQRSQPALQLVASVWVVARRPDGIIGRSHAGQIFASFVL